MAEIKSLLDGVIEQEIQNVEALSSGSDEKSESRNPAQTPYRGDQGRDRGGREA